MRSKRNTASRTTELRTPPKDDIWLHIDHFDKKSREVWAVQYWDFEGKLHYKVASYVAILPPNPYGGWTPIAVETVFKKDGKEPRAYIAFTGARVQWIKRGHAIIY